jgi:hypothetical protein
MLTPDMMAFVSTEHKMKKTAMIKLRSHMGKTKTLLINPYDIFIPNEYLPPPLFVVASDVVNFVTTQCHMGKTVSITPVWDFSRSH